MDNEKNDAPGLQIKQEIKPIEEGKETTKMKIVKTSYRPIECNFNPVTDPAERTKITEMMITVLVRENKKAGYEMPQAEIDQAMDGFKGCQLLVNKRVDGTNTVIILGHYELNKSGEISFGYNCAMLEANAEMNDYVESRFISNIVDPE